MEGLHRLESALSISAAGRLDRVLLGCGAAAGPLFIAGFTAAGAGRPNYNPIRHPVSSLALGKGGWIQGLNFGINGVLYVGLAAGLARKDSPTTPRAGPLLIAAAGLGQITAGLFTTDPVSGYPPGTPAQLDRYSGAEALIHDLAAVPVFLGIPVTALLWARSFARHGRRHWARYSGITAATMTTGFVLTSAAFAQARAIAPLGGLLQRLTVALGMGWLSALSVRELTTPSPPTGAP